MPLPGEDGERSVVPGDVLAGKWRVERTLGKGGMGQVLAARHVKLGTQVAIKVVHPELVTDPAVVERFLREAHAMARLRSEHTVRVLDVGETEQNVPYIIMEYLDGRDLGAVLVDRGPLPIALAVEYARQASEALAEAHEAGIVHRDVKPHNLFLSKRGSAEIVRVLDFGLAKAVTSSLAHGPQLTQAGDVLGSPHYMPPEQVLGRAIDPRADVWGLGATLYRLLTREFPFARGNPALVTTAVLREEPLPLRGIRPEIPAAVASIVARCLVKDPAGRFQSMRELGSALAHAGAALLPPHGAIPRAFRPPSIALAPTPSAFAPPAAASAPPPAERPRGGTAIAVGAFMTVIALAAVGYGAWRHRAKQMESVRAAPPSPVVSITPRPPLSALPPTRVAPVPDDEASVAPQEPPAPSPTVTASPAREPRVETQPSASARRVAPPRPLPTPTAPGGVYDSL